jgi:hypothetical protein
MLVAGVETTPSTVAELALQLHRAGEVTLAGYVGRAVDRDLPELDLSARDCADIVRALQPPTAPLEHLHAALLRRAGHRPRGARC